MLRMECIVKEGEKELCTVGITFSSCTQSDEMQQKEKRNLLLAGASLDHEIQRSSIETVATHKSVIDFCSKTKELLIHPIDPVGPND